MHSLARCAATLALAAAGVVAVYGCTEKLEGGNTCPLLCPGQSIELQDTLLAAISIDTTLPGFPSLGAEPLLTLAARGDTLDTRIIVRYDTLPSVYRPTSATTDAPIEALDSARLAIRIQYPNPDSLKTLTVEAYDVDTTTTDPADTTAASMLPLFRTDRFLGAVTFTPRQVATTNAPGATTPDSTLRIPIDSTYLLTKILGKGRLRVGLLLRSAESAEVTFQGLNALRAVNITLYVPSSTPVPVATPYSAVPTERFVGSQLSDFVIVAARRPPETPAAILAVGGVPGKRTYFRFDLPSKIVDSTSVVRATLLLTQYPNRLAARPDDSVSVYPSPVAAGENVTDIRTAAGLLSPIFATGLRDLFRLDSLRLAPNDSGQVEVEVVGVVQAWRATTPAQATRALVLNYPFAAEGVVTQELYFFSTEAGTEELRPKLRIVYAPRVGFGLP